MAITTKHSDVAIANYLVSLRDSAYVGIAKTTEWDDDLTPPSPSELTTTLEDLIGLKPVRELSVCKRVATPEDTDYPTIQYNNQTWALLSPEQAFKENATHVYVEAYIGHSDFPSGPYRQVGFFTGVKHNSENDIILPEEITDKGLLVFYENRQPINRIDNMNITERFIIKVGND